MPNQVSKLLKGYAQFYDKYFIENPQTYQELADQGQSPKALVIACSDSRVDPSIVFDCSPGDIFVIRNVANIVPPFEGDNTTSHGTSAAIEYAVNNLKVEDIVILGHSDCGGIKTLLDEEDNDHMFIEHWLQNIEAAKGKKAASGEEYCCANELCGKEGVRISMQNLLTFPFIKAKVEAGELELHGWYIHLHTGKLDII